MNMIFEDSCRCIFNTFLKKLRKPETPLFPICCSYRRVSVSGSSVRKSRQCRTAPFSSVSTVTRSILWQPVSAPAPTSRRSPPKLQTVSKLKTIVKRISAYFYCRKRRKDQFLHLHFRTASGISFFILHFQSRPPYSNFPLILHFIQVCPGLYGLKKYMRPVLSPEIRSSVSGNLNDPVISDIHD